MPKPSLKAAGIQQLREQQVGELEGHRLCQRLRIESVSCSYFKLTPHLTLPTVKGVRVAIEDPANQAPLMSVVTWPSGHQERDNIVINIQLYLASIWGSWV